MRLRRPGEHWSSGAQPVYESRPCVAHCGEAEPLRMAQPVPPIFFFGALLLDSFFFFPGPAVTSAECRIHRLSGERCGRVERPGLFTATRGRGTGGEAVDEDFNIGCLLECQAYISILFAFLLLVMFLLLPFASSTSPRDIVMFRDFFSSIFFYYFVISLMCYNVNVFFLGCEVRKTRFERYSAMSMVNNAVKKISGWDKEKQKKKKCGSGIFLLLLDLNSGNATPASVQR